MVMLMSTTEKRKKYLEVKNTSTDNDTFLYEKTIYKKVISSVDATNILNKLFKNKFEI